MYNIYRGIGDTAVLSITINYNVSFHMKIIYTHKKRGGTIWFDNNPPFRFLYSMHHLKLMSFMLCSQESPDENAILRAPLFKLVKFEIRLRLILLNKGAFVNRVLVMYLQEWWMLKKDINLRPRRQCHEQHHVSCPGSREDKHKEKASLFKFISCGCTFLFLFFWAVRTFYISIYMYM